MYNIYLIGNVDNIILNQNIFYFLVYGEIDMLISMQPYQ